MARWTATHASTKDYYILLLNTKYLIYVIINIECIFEYVIFVCVEGRERIVIINVLVFSMRCASLFLTFWLFLLSLLVLRWLLIGRNRNIGSQLIDVRWQLPLIVVRLRLELLTFFYLYLIIGTVEFVMECHVIGGNRRIEIILKISICRLLIVVFDFIGFVSLLHLPRLFFYFSEGFTNVRAYLLKMNCWWFVCGSTVLLSLLRHVHVLAYFALLRPFGFRLLWNWGLIFAIIQSIWPLLQILGVEPVAWILDCYDVHPQ